MNRFFAILLGFFVLCLASFEAKAQYTFTAKVINKTGHTLDKVSARYRAKGVGHTRDCWVVQFINAGDSYQAVCQKTYQSAEKWQRQIRVKFTKMER